MYLWGWYVSDHHLHWVQNSHHPIVCEQRYTISWLLENILSISSQNESDQANASLSILLASSPGSLLKNKGEEREPGNICGKSCWLPPPCSGGTNQIVERNHVYTWHFVQSAKNCQLENELVSIDYTSKVGKKQFSDGWKSRKSRESKIKVCCNWFAGPTHSPYLAAPSLHVQSVSRNSTQLWMPRRRGAKL